MFSLHWVERVKVCVHAHACPYAQPSSYRGVNLYYRWWSVLIRTGNGEGADYVGRLQGRRSWADLSAYSRGYKVFSRFHTLVFLLPILMLEQVLILIRSTCVKPLVFAALWLADWPFALTGKKKNQYRRLFLAAYCPLGGSLSMLRITLWCTI